MRISDWSSDVCSSDLDGATPQKGYPMVSMKPLTELDTHEVFNQPPPLEGVSLYCGDAPLTQAVSCAGGGAHEQRLENLGRSEERRVGKACVSTCRSRGSTCP